MSDDLARHRSRRQPRRMEMEKGKDDTNNIVEKRRVDFLGDGSIMEARFPR